MTDARTARRLLTLATLVGLAGASLSLAGCGDDGGDRSADTVVRASSSTAPRATTTPSTDHESAGGVVALRFTQTERSSSNDHTSVPAVSVDRAHTTASDAATAAIVTWIEDRVRNELQAHTESLADNLDVSVGSGTALSGDLVVKAHLRVSRPGLAVVELEGSDFTGGAHGLPIVESAVFDTRTGTTVLLRDVLDAGGLKALVTGAREGLLAAFAHSGDQPDEQLDNGLADSESIWAWWPTSTGIHLVFGPYTVGPYAIGTPEVEVPWALLESHVHTDLPLRP